MTESAPLMDSECTTPAADSAARSVAVNTRALDTVEGRTRWHDALDTTFCEMDVTWPQRQRPFTAEMTARPIADLSISVVHADPHTVVRSPAMIESDSLDDYLLCLATGGSVTLDQDGHSGTLTRGGFGIVDAAKPFVISGVGEFSQVVLRMPRAALDSRATTRSIVDSAVGLGVSGQSGVGRLVSSLLVDVATHDDDISVGASSTVAGALLDMIVTALNDVGAPVTPVDRAHADDLRHVQRIMVSHIDNPDHTIASVSAEAGMSVRYVHKLFSTVGATPRSWLTLQRLDRARTLLLQTPLTVEDVGRQTGFRDPSHFSRAFRRQYGASPAQYRTASRPTR